jgi:hypothetical protein
MNAPLGALNGCDVGFMKRLKLSPGSRSMALVKWSHTRFAAVKSANYTPLLPTIAISLTGETCPRAKQGFSTVVIGQQL